MNTRFLKSYQCALFSFGVFLFLMGLFNAFWLPAVLGVFIALMSAGTVLHLLTGKHNKLSKLPEDFNH